MLADSLLIEITNCPVVSACRNDPSASRCARVVSAQSNVSWSDYHVPEPWNGDLETARVLFVSSNPAIDKQERYPTPRWPDEQRIDFFRHRFSGGNELWTLNFRTLMQTGEHDRAPRAGKYWSEIHRRAVELLGPNAQPGIDYALTEVVHCKSSANQGVDQAADKCASLYLDRVLEASGARVIVVVGEKARAVFEKRFAGPPRNGSKEQVNIGGKQRMLISLGAPGGPDPRKLTASARRSELDSARRLLEA